jgi:hypothetical protein
MKNAKIEKTTETLMETEKNLFTSVSISPPQDLGKKYSALIQTENI